MKSDEINKALDRLDKFDFFNQRAGRELWNDKPTDIQNQDIDDYSKDIEFLKSFIYRQQAEIKTLRMDNNQLQDDIVNANCNYEQLKDDCELLKTALAQKVVSEIKSEAIKEFAERLNDQFGKCTLIRDCFYVGYDINDVSKAIDNLVKEMVGD